MSLQHDGYAVYSGCAPLPFDTHHLLCTQLQLTQCHLPFMVLTSAWPTCLQMTSLALLLLAKDGGSGALVEFAAAAGPILLIVAAFLTIQSLCVYFTSGWKYLF
jgi:hypothetical protein